jgi:hypothetical protein
MATTFKALTTSDITHTRTLLHEAVPITGSIVSGTYAGEGNIKNYSHGMFQSVYDYPYLSSSANHIFDLTVGYSDNSALSGGAKRHNEKKINTYNHMAQVLVGFDHTGSVREFDKDGTLTGGTKIREAFFINFARLLTKDEIKKGSFTMSLASGSSRSPMFDANVLLSVSDISGSKEYKVNSPAGEYGLLYTGSAAARPDTAVGLIYYQAGIVVLTASVFVGEFGAAGATYDNAKVESVLTGALISSSCDSLRHRVNKIEFDNTTELNSTIYFCRAHHNDFNYSSNPTYLSASRIRVKATRRDDPVSYVTAVGLYSADNALLAVAKLSEPLKKTPSTEVTLRCRLDY